MHVYYLGKTRTGRLYVFFFIFRNLKFISTARKSIMNLVKLLYEVLMISN